MVSSTRREGLPLTVSKEANIRMPTRSNLSETVRENRKFLSRCMRKPGLEEGKPEPNTEETLAMSLTQCEKRAGNVSAKEVLRIHRSCQKEVWFPSPSKTVVKERYLGSSSLTSAER